MRTSQWQAVTKFFICWFVSITSSTWFCKQPAVLGCIECMRCRLLSPMCRVCQSVCHKCTEWSCTVKPTWDRFTVRGHSVQPSLNCFGHLLLLCTNKVKPMCVFYATKLRNGFVAITYSMFYSIDNRKHLLVFLILELYGNKYNTIR